MPDETDQSCVFCQVVSGDMPSKKVYEDELTVAFEDVRPQAPTHVLLIPREHIESLNDASHSDEQLLGHMMRTAAKVANQLGIAEDGFRTVINTGPNGGQTVPHLHLHILGGRFMTWPPG